MKKSGLALALLLIVALIAALLAVTRLRGADGGEASPEVAAEAAVSQAQELVDQLNAAQQRTLEQLEDFAP